VLQSMEPSSPGSTNCIIVLLVDIKLTVDCPASSLTDTVYISKHPKSGREE
jgi:hypothetical protein